jgi:hypothetical protein
MRRTNCLTKGDDFMAFCGKCGSKINQGDAFCSSCGTKVNSNNTAKANNGTSYSYESSDDNIKNAAKFALYFCGAVAALSVMAFLMRDNMGLVISAVLVAVVLFGAYMPLKRGTVGSAPTICITCAGVAAAIGIFVLMKGKGNTFVGILDIAAAVPGFMAWQSAKNL